MKRGALLRLLSVGLVLMLASTVSAQDIAKVLADNTHMPMCPDGMNGSSMSQGPHIKLTVLREPSQADEDRAAYVLETCRRSLVPYHNYRVALAQGFRIFLPQIPQPVYHFTNYVWSGEEYRGNFDPNHPGSVLYVRGDSGDYELVGAMYSAPPEYTEDQLNDLIPLSVARWHQHVNICLPADISINDLLMGEVGAGHAGMPGMLPVANNPSAESINDKVGFLADGRFGFEGKIADRAACEAAGGHFVPLAFGWMVHVYPLNGDDRKVAFGLGVPKPSRN